LSSSLQDSKQADIYCWEVTTTDNVAGAVIDQSNGIIVSNLIKAWQLLEIGQERRACVFKENFGIDVRLCMSF
jgi:hypothetical protein